MRKFLYYVRKLSTSNSLVHEKFINSQVNDQFTLYLTKVPEGRPVPPAVWDYFSKLLLSLCHRSDFNEMFQYNEPLIREFLALNELGCTSENKTKLINLSARILLNYSNTRTFYYFGDIRPELFDSLKKDNLAINMLDDEGR